MATQDKGKRERENDQAEWKSPFSSEIREDHAA